MSKITIFTARGSKSRWTVVSPRHIGTQGDDWGVARSASSHVASPREFTATGGQTSPSDREASRVKPRRLLRGIVKRSVSRMLAWLQSPGVGTALAGEESTSRTRQPVRSPPAGGIVTVSTSTPGSRQFGTRLRNASSAHARSLAHRDNGTRARWSCLVQLPAPVFTACQGTS